jgi:NADPH2 dehydrogenase
MLFSPLETDKISLVNRVVMPSMGTRKASAEGTVTEAILEHYLLRARSGPGLIMIEHAFVERAGKLTDNQLGADKDDKLAGLQLLAKRIHETGVKVGLQINHVGSAASSKITGQAVVAPSSQLHPKGTDTPCELGQDDMKRIKKLFVDSACRAQNAGFDLVEIHGAHGYLLNQFFSPLTNTRSDQYGGSLEKRARFPLEIVAEVRKKLGQKFCILFRLGADDRYPTGITPEDSRIIAPMLVEAGVDVLDLSGGLCGSRIDTGPGFYLYLARVIKPVVKIPVMISGGITSAEQANRLVIENVADLVGIGRAQLNDPEWTKKAYQHLQAGI